MPTVFTDGSALTALTERLRAAGCVFAAEEARLLSGAATSEAELVDLVEQRLRGDPLEHLLGWAEFDGLRIALDAGVYVPRQRSQLIVTSAVDQVRTGSVVLDVCCGSGALGAALRQRVPGVELYAADLDERAVACARRNLPAGRVFLGDLFDPFPVRLEGRVDLILVNAPYVPTDALGLMPREARLYEPRAAHDGGPDGLDVQRRVAADARSWLRSGGVVIAETSESQADATARLLRQHGFSVRLRRSAELDATVAVGTLSVSGDA